MKQHTHVGVYGLVIKNDKILLIDKITGPYDGLFDLPGGSFEFGETPVETLKREFKEETGIDIIKYELFDSNSVLVDWDSDYGLIKVHHIGIFYRITEYEGQIKEKISIDKHNDDSLGACFYNINDLNKEDLSSIVVLELEKLGYKLK